MDKAARPIVELHRAIGIVALTDESALAIVRRSRPDLILVTLPGMRGLELLRALRRLDSTLPVIAIEGVRALS